ncbi:MAG TPA: YjdF family protein [Polyangiaceae bacterium]
MGSFIVFFDGQFWVGLATRTRDGQSEIARVVFGPEPSDAELVAFAHDVYRTIAFLPSDEPLARERAPGNPKRRQREARRALESPAERTKAQEAMRLAIEERKTTNEAGRTERRREEAAARFARHRAKKKRKLRGK